MSNVYIMCGRTGAGKTTLAKKIASELGAFRFSHDEMLRTLHGEKIEDFEAACEGVNRLILKQTEELLNLNVPVIIEGWGGRKRRDELRNQLAELGADFTFIYVVCPVEVRLERVLNRNRDVGVEGFRIDEECFFRMEQIDEEFDSDEACMVLDNSKNSELPRIKLD